MIAGESIVRASFSAKTLMKKTRVFEVKIELGIGGERR